MGSNPTLDIKDLDCPRHAELAQLVERTAFNRMVVGSSPTEDTFSHGSSVGQSARLLTVWSWVQVPLVTHSSIAQLAERPAVNR